MSDKQRLLDDIAGEIDAAIYQENGAQSFRNEINCDTEFPEPAPGTDVGVVVQLIKPDPIRWYILAVFASMNALSNIIWNTFGPIAESAELVFGWTDATIAMISNWGPIAFLPCFFFAWLMDVKGMRISCLITALFMFIGATIRCAAVYKPMATWSIHVGQLLNGLAGNVLGGGPPLISAIWFPVRERTTATAVASCFGGIGTSITYLLGPAVVSDVTDMTECKRNGSSWINNISTCNEKIHEMHSQIMILIYIESAAAFILLLLVLVYFPDRPRHSPSLTASLQRTDFKHGILQLMRNGKFWMMVVPATISLGVFMCWGSLVDVNLKPLGIDEDEAGLIGFLSHFIGQGTAILIGISADHIFVKKTKFLLSTMYSVASLCFLIFALQCAAIIPLHTATFYATSILGSICLYGTIPLFIELGCETSYPVAEGITNTMLSLMFNISGIVFLLIFLIPNIGTVWMNWCLVACITVCIPVWIFYKYSYRRLDVDKSIVNQLNE